MSSEKVDGIKEWIEECINGPSGYKSFIDHENLGVYPDDLALAGAVWIIRCLAQPHAKDVLEAVNRQAAKNAPPQPPQPGDRVLVPAVIVDSRDSERVIVRVGRSSYTWFPLSAIHPAPQPAKNGE